MTVDENPFAAVLAVVASLESTHSGSEHVCHALECTAQDAGLDVAGLLVAQVETTRHAKFDVQLPSRVAVDGERCAGALLVASDGSWLTTADDGEGACWVDALEVFGWEVLGKLTYVVLAMLFPFVSVARTRHAVATSATHTAEEVSYEHNDLSVLCVVELVESDGLATLVKDLQLAGFSESLLVGSGVTLTLFCSHICSGDVYKIGQVKSS